MHDFEAWEKYPQHRKWFNKLYVADLFGYDCGPSGTAPSVSGKYIVRPIYNLSGMGLGASVKYIEKGDYKSTPVGYFWCNFFIGKQYSITYNFLKNEWIPISSFEGKNDINNLSKFSYWKRSNYYIDFPKEITNLKDVNVVNIEFIENKPFEVHLRDTPDPDYDIFLPIWKGEKNNIEKFKKKGYKFVSSYEDANGFLETPRIGFMVKNGDYIE